MRLRDFLIERLPQLGLAVVTSAAAVLFALIARVPATVVVAVAAVLLSVAAAATWRGYADQRRFFARLRDTLTLLDEKSYIADLVDRPAFPSGQVVYDVVDTLARSTNGELERYRIAEEDYQSYVEAWIHEIKTPLTTLKLIAANHPELGRELTVETDRVDSAAEQALFFARSSSVQHDYRIRAVRLGDVVDRVLRRAAAPLVAARCRIERSNLDAVVYSDPQWLDFVVKQLVVNAAKYRSHDPLLLHFEAVQATTVTVLRIADNGLGIPAAELPDIGRRGFVGENGRRLGGSTGLGVFLCRRLCAAMNIGFAVQSEHGTGTTVSLTFAHDSGLMRPTDLNTG